jgi:ankyrin repeat protein
MNQHLEPIFGATFEGHLCPPDGDKCRIKYSFAAQTKLPVPQAVLTQRRALGLGYTTGVLVLPATCSIPTLGLEDEAVIVSIDSTSSGQLLLQSLERPDLGVTVLVISSDGLELSGGDETWSTGDTPVIQVIRVETVSSPSSSTKKSEASKAGRFDDAENTASGYPPKPVVPENAEPGPTLESTAAAQSNLASTAVPEKAEPGPTLKSTAAAQSILASTAVPQKAVPGPTLKSTAAAQSTLASIVVDDGFRDPRDPEVGAWRTHISTPGPHTPVDGGIGRSVMGAAAEERHAPSKIAMEDASLLQKPSASEMPSTAAASMDEEIIAAKVENVERLVSAAAAGEIGDMKLLGARVGINTAGSASGLVRQPGLTPLMAAAEKGRTDAVNFLIEQGADLDAADPQGWTAVMHAISRQRSEILKLLLKAGASAVVSGADENTTPLHLAATGARPELVATLLSLPATALPASAREAKDSTGRTALHVASKNGRNGSVVALLKAKGRIEAHDDEGRTPLLTAAESGHPESVRILLAARADAAAKNVDGKSALDLARLWGHERVLEALSSSSNAG